MTGEYSYREVIAERLAAAARHVALAQEALDGGDPGPLGLNAAAAEHELAGALKAYGEMSRRALDRAMESRS